MRKVMNDMLQSVISQVLKQMKLDVVQRRQKEWKDSNVHKVEDIDECNYYLVYVKLGRKFMTEYWKSCVCASFKSAKNWYSSSLAICECKIKRMVTLNLVEVLKRHKKTHLLAMKQPINIEE